MKLKKIIVMIILVFCMLLISKTNYAKEAYYKVNSEIPSKYTTQYLLKNNEKELNKIDVDFDNKKVIITCLDTSYNVTSTKKLDLELTRFGNAYCGKDYNFIVFGQNNPTEDNNVEVFRVVKYSKKWERIASSSNYGANTIKPFQAGDCRITEVNGILVVNTCHQMYTSSDGLNHQANVMLQIRISDMQNLAARTGVWNFEGNGYVSHSFDQFIKTDGTYVYTVDEGDAYPRGIAVARYGFGGVCYYLNASCCIYKSDGAIGNNYTGYDVTAEELGSNNIIISGTSIDMSKGLYGTSRKNVYLWCVPKMNLSTSNTKIKQITSFAENDDTVISCVNLTKINNNKFLLSWKESSNTKFGYLKMVLVDENGEMLTDVITVGGEISTTIKPIMFDNKVVWTYGNTNINTVVFYLDMEKFNEYKNLNLINNKTFEHFSLSYSSYYNEVEISKYDDSSENVTIPYKTIPYLKIKLGSKIFEECSKVKNVIIEEGYDNTGSSSFSNAQSIESVVIPESCIEISQNSFYNCTNLKKVEIKGNKLKKIKSYAFSNTAITEITFPSSLETIEAYAFYYSAIKKANFPKSIKEIGEAGFYACTFSNLKFENPNIKLGSSAFSISKTITKGESKKYINGINFDDYKFYMGADYVQVGKDGTVKANGGDYATIGFIKDNKVCIILSLEIKTPIVKEENNTSNNTVNKDTNKPTNKQNENTGLPFYDVSKDAWYFNAVKYTYNNKIISGYSKTEFAPNDMLTRGMIVTILYRMEGSPNNDGKSEFSDVETNAWYSKAIKWAVRNEIVHGYGGTNNFGPKDNILRQDLAGILRNYANYKNKNVKVSSDLSKFSDSKNISGYAKASMKWAVGKGVITGNKNGTLNPKGNATRAEAAAMIQKYCEKVGR